jgi:DNA-binding CsgD family transcriptional regulator
MSSSPTPAPSSDLGAWPLAGRDTELEHIARLLSDPSCRGAVISAPAGAGKTRLAREAVAAAEQGGALAFWVQATNSAAAVPLAALAALIPEDVRSDEPLELMRRSADALRNRADGRTVLLAVDDAQLLDPVSAALVLHVATAANVFVLATIRSGEPCPDAIVSLWKDVGAERMGLEQLGDEAIEALVEAALGGPLEQAALHWVTESSRGNALYVRELVVGAIKGGTLRLDRGLWRLAGSPNVGPTLVELIERRMSGLASEPRMVIELLALGEPLRLNEIAGVTGYEPLAAAEAAGLVTITVAGAVAEARLAHPLYGDVVRGQLPVLRARDLRLRLAETLQTREPITPDDALRVTRWLLDAGSAIPADLLLGAARAANLAGDPELGGRLAELAVDAGAGLSASLVLARSYTVRRRPEDAEAVLAAAEPWAPGTAQARDYLEQRVAGLFWGLKRPEDARELLARAQTWSADPGWTRRLDPVRLGLTGLTEGFLGSAAAGEELLADPELDDAGGRTAQAVRGLALFSAGRAREAYELVWRHRPSVPLEDHNDALILGTCWMFGTESGEDWAGLDRYMSQVLRDGVRAADHEAAGIAAFTLAHLRFLEGRYRDAGRWLTESELNFEHQDTFGGLLHIRVLQLGVEYFTGNLPAVGPALDAVHAVVGARKPLPNQRPYIARAEGWAARARSDAAGAERLMGDAATLKVPIQAAQLTYEALRAGATPAITAARLTEIAGRSDARLVAAYAEHAQALAGRDGWALLEAAETMAGIGALRYGLEAALHAARTFLAAGREDSARRAVKRARELHASDQGTELPEVDGLDSAATDLTRREAQIAALAARGLSNAEIASQLVLSVRTVETYVYRAMLKRGVDNRHDL